MEFFEILCGIAAAIFLLYYFFTSTFDFWKSRGVPGPRPIPGFGTFKNVVLGKVSLSGYMKELNNDYKDEPLVGIFAGRTPILIVKHPDLIKDILIKDFSIFPDRWYRSHDKSDPLSQNLFELDSKRWRPLRAKLTPVFTSRKLKEMFVLISECSDHLVQYVEKLVNKNEPIECVEMTAKYTTDVIGSCVFGIEMNAMSDEDSEFRRIGRSVFHPSFWNRLRFAIKDYLPWLFDVLYGYILPQPENTRFFMRIVLETMDYRETNNITRNDFIDTLRELKKHSDKMGDIDIFLDLTDSLIVSQAFVFFAAGFETSSTAMTNAFYELALNQEIQNRLRDEIDQEYIKHAGNLTYANIKEMNYLDKVFKEVLRKYSAGLFFTRRTMSSYTFNGTKVSIPKGQIILIPWQDMHQDPNIYPEPDVFDPERFNEEAVRSRHPMVYLPFGGGPRNCIGSRFAVYQTKLGLIKILRNYKVEPCEKTQVPYAIDDKHFLLTPKDGIYLRIIKINRD
ncbi:probable cytochrome P450 6a14 isoform X1 [Temnothorax longispinosus]|uniref:probable cytochrome P450 6a14 isoform X1 n=1 Tax=Temnothorax longispinosus TaxID=300112 RepID=UPI003A9932E6